MQDFLQMKQTSTSTAAKAPPSVAANTPDKDVGLKVMLPDKSVITVSIQERWRTREVYRVSGQCVGLGDLAVHDIVLFLSQAVAKKVGLSEQAAKFFGLFQRMEHAFGTLVSTLIHQRGLWP